MRERGRRAEARRRVTAVLALIVFVMALYEGSSPRFRRDWDHPVTTIRAASTLEFRAY
jgi:hypothetical protein